MTNQEAPRLKRRYPAALARTVGQWLIAALEESVERVQIAGSVRRSVEEVGDVEILYVPRWGEDPKADLFGGPRRVDLVDRKLLDLIQLGALEKRRGETGKLAGYGDENKYLVSTGTGVPIDVFRTTVGSWGMALVVRTGPAEWNIAMMSRFRRLGMAGHLTGVTRGGFDLPCPDEEAVFELLGLAYVPPDRRSEVSTYLPEGGTR